MTINKLTGILILYLHATMAEHQTVTYSCWSDTTYSLAYRVVCHDSQACIYRPPDLDDFARNCRQCVSTDSCHVSLCDDCNHGETGCNFSSGNNSGSNTRGLSVLNSLFLCGEYFSSSNVSFQSIDVANPLGFIDFKLVDLNVSELERLPTEIFFKEIDVLIGEEGTHVHIFQYPFNTSEDELQCWWWKQNLEFQDVHQHDVQDHSINQIEGDLRRIKKRSDVIITRRNDSVEITVEACYETLSLFGVVIIYVHNIFSVISFLSVIIIIWLHLKFQKLRNVYGFCLVSLSFTIGLSDAFTIARTVLRLFNDNGTALSVILHYVWFSLFSWELVTIFHVYRSVRGGRVANEMTTYTIDSWKSTTTKYYAIVGWGTALPFVMSGVICHLLDNANFEYNRHFFEREAFYLIFTIPISCLVFCGLSLLALLFLDLCKKGRRKNLRRLATKRHLIHGAVRLKITLGLPWAGFIACNVIPYNLLLPSIHTVISLQGFLILMSLLSTKRVRNIVKNSSHSLAY